jgi:hypothetical protein
MNVASLYRVYNPNVFYFIVTQTDKALAYLG